MQPPPRTPLLRKGVVWIAFVAVILFTWKEGLGSVDDTVQVGGGPFRFQEVATRIGASFRHQRPEIDARVSAIAAQITAVGASVSVNDFDADGDPDLYVTNSADGAPNGLFENLGDGRFRDVAAQLGVADVNRAGVGVSMGSVWGDYDNDGRDDLLIYKWGYPQLFHNEGEAGFRDITAESGLKRWVNSNAATWIDYDRDGFLDLYLTGYFPAEHDLWNLETTRIMHDSFEFAKNGGDNLLFHGRGDGTFEDVTEAMNAGSNRWTYAAVTVDVDRDGWVDLYVANDYGAEEVFLNREGQTFERPTNVGLGGESKSGMCVALGDLHGGDRPSMFVTNISKEGYLFQGNNLRVSWLDRGGELEQFASGPLVDCGWAWGAQFGDLDNDRYQDLVVVNGFISASKERDYWYQMSKISLATGDVVEDAAKWPDFEDRSLSGYENARVLHNLRLRGARFREVGRESGLDSTYDGRAVVLTDLFGSGKLDVVIANQNGPLEIWRNETDTNAHWISIRLEGTRSGRNAFGAEVRVIQPDRTQLRVNAAFSGFSSQGDPRQHFGLGESGDPVAVEIRWPSGQVQTLEKLEVDRVHHVEEPR
ncbi:MAG: CRTAC1 family protein [Planctomycetes bacterium]|nr:CRTAC1 family protein [Planctomycetota bacterium]